MTAPRIRMLFLALLLAGSALAQRYVDVGDGVRLWVVERGNGTPIVIIHGGPGMDAGSLSGDLGPLEKAHRIIYYDQRGGGRSTLPADTKALTIDDHVRDLEALRQSLGLQKVTLLAHSFGPAIAARYAIAHPDRVERMVFLSPIPPVKGKFFEEYGASLMKRLTDEQRSRAEELQKSLETSDDTTKVCHDYWAIMTAPRVAKSLSADVVKSDLCTAPPEAIKYGMTKTNPATFGSLGDWNWTEELKKVKAPVLVIHGDEDAIPMAMVTGWVTALPNARILRLAHTAHFPHAERPNEVFPAIEYFLHGDWPRKASAK